MQPSSEPIAEQRSNTRMVFSAFAACGAMVAGVVILSMVGCGDGSTIEVLRYANGGIKQEKTMRAGPGGRLIPDGPTIIYYDNGQIDEEMTFVQGKLQGKHTLWYENGKKKGESEWDEGRRVSEWVRWDLNGNLMTPDEDTPEADGS